MANEAGNDTYDWAEALRLAKDPATPLALLRHLRMSSHVRVLASPAMPARLLWQWLQPPGTFDTLTDHWAMRYAIARNPSANARTLIHLAHDGNRYVRAAARATLAQRNKDE